MDERKNLFETYYIKMFVVFPTKSNMVELIQTRNK